VVFGQSAVGALSITNATGIEARIESVESDCACLQISGCPVILSPGETNHLKVHFNSQEEPAFRGRLAIGVLGRGIDDERVFSTRVHVEVLDGPRVAR
jgi:hypothetical protein